MRISIPDDYQKVIRNLTAFQMLAGHEVTILHEYIDDVEELAVALNDPEAIVLTRTRTSIGEELLQKLPNLKIISQTGKNAGHIDMDACKKYGVTVLEGRGNPISTAELTWALIMNGLRKLPQAIAAMKDGRWQTNIGHRVHGKSIGIWGYGKIGKLIAQYATAFGAKVIVWGSELAKVRAREDGFRVAKNKQSFFEGCDVISLHLRLKEATYGIVKKEDLLAMKKEALLVNTARAALIEEGALLATLKSGQPGMAALDVFDEEPIYTKDHPLLSMPNVICTPHLGYVEVENYELYFSIAFENLLAFVKR